MTCLHLAGVAQALLPARRRLRVCATLILLACIPCFAQPASPEIESRLAPVLAANPGERLVFASSEGEPDLIYVALRRDGADEPAEIRVLEEVTVDGQTELRRVDQRPDLPGNQGLLVTDATGQRLWNVSSIKAELQPDGSCRLTVACEGNARGEGAGVGESTVRPALSPQDEALRPRPAPRSD